MKRTVFGAAALVILAVGQSARGQVHRYEAESAPLANRVGVSYSNAVAGYSGSGYITGFDSPAGTDSLTLQVDVPDGLYEMWVGYRSQYGNKGYDFSVDGETGSGMFDYSETFTADRAGVFNVTGGTNTLSIRQSWGYYDVDYWEFRPFTPPTVLPVPTQLVDPLANQRTRQLMNYLVSQYGSKTLSGQQGNVGSNVAFPTADYLTKSNGVVPAIRGSDFIEYSPSRIAHGSNPNGESERIINWAKQTGGIVSMMWHWNAPTDLIDQPGKEWWRGFYTDSTTFDVQAALANPGSAKYNLLVSDIDAIAVQLQKFEDANIPVIWRPLHEAQGTWFWWGAKGPQAFKDLWHLMYDRLTNVKGLHNLIWEFTSSAAEGNFLDWYPGDDEVDMIGLDVYTDPTSSMSGQWYDVLANYNGRKMVSLSETGTLPDPNRMDTYDTDWSYFSPWTWDYIRDQYITQRGYTEGQLQTLLRNLLNGNNVITLDELPAFPWNSTYNQNGVWDIADYTAWRDSLGRTGTNLAADGNGDGKVDQADYLLFKARFGNAVSGAGSLALSSGAVPEPIGCTLLLCGVIGLGLAGFRAIMRCGEVPTPAR